MISIRAAELKDIPSLKRLFLQLGYKPDSANLEQRISEQHDRLCTLVAVSENEVCGVIVINFIMPVHEDSLWALVSALVIDESARGQGVGQQLLIASEHIAALKKCSQIELSSSEKRVKAHNFYEKNGYKEVRKRFVKLLRNLPPA
ncbi:GNAT family N-acetyltransferase [Yokenella regensburgei]|uniref:GNAT family N-acetyltransferase n=1 Tax=Yokenella regensburgei TaxID=158877 RepID=UPI003F190020